MTARLKTLEFVPRPGGWSAGVLEFGSFLTFVSGENGAGKTPVMKAIVYALGHPIKLTERVRTQCVAIRLKLLLDGRLLQLERSIDDGDGDGNFVTRLTDGREEVEFTSEPDFTEWLLATLQIPSRPLAGKERGTVIKRPYASVLTPTYWLDQDRGWHVVKGHSDLGDPRPEDRS